MLIDDKCYNYKGINNDLKKIVNNLERKLCKHPNHITEINFLFENFSINKSIKYSSIEFTSSIYALKVKESKCDIVLKRTDGNADSEILVK